MNTREYDVVVLGGGIAGYTAAVRASQLGMKAAVIERDKLGGLACTAAVFRANRSYAVLKCCIRFAAVSNLAFRQGHFPFNFQIFKVGKIA